MKPMHVDAGPLVRRICEQLDVIPIIDDAVPWERRHSKLSPGERICALIISCFLRQRPLYRVFLSFLTTDCEVLLGRGVVATDVNDDALGRALDKLAAAEPRKVFAAMYAALGPHPTARSCCAPSAVRVVGAPVGWGSPAAHRPVALVDSWPRTTASSV